MSPAPGLGLLAPRYADDGRSLVPLSAAQREARAAVRRKVDDGDYTLEVVPCAVCGGRRRTRLAEKDRFGLRCAVGVCDDCGLVQTNPRLRAEAYADHYRTDYVALHDDGFTEDEVFAREQRRAEEIVRYLDTVVDDSFPLRGALVVEVGCGSGGILDVFRAHGADVIGVDLGPSRLAHGRSRGLDLREGTLATLDVPRPPNLIVYAHVLEHVLDPAAELARIRKALAPGGHLYVEVPGIKRLDLYEDDFLRYLQHAHVFHFSATTLDNLLGAHGFAARDVDETVRGLYRPTDSPPPAWRDDRAAVLETLADFEARRRRPHPKQAARAVLSRFGLYDAARRLKRLTEKG